MAEEDERGGGLENRGSQNMAHALAKQAAAGLFLSEW